MSSTGTSRTPNGSHPWMSHASCTHPSIDPDLFLPSGRDEKKTRRALAVCRACPVLDQCREWSITNGFAPHMVVGGMTASMLRRERTLRGIDPGRPIDKWVETPHGTPEGHRAHQREGSRPCADCVAAQRALQERARAEGRKVPRAPVREGLHGSYAGYRAHVARLERACPACSEAAREYGAQLRERQRAG